MFSPGISTSVSSRSFAEMLFSSGEFLAMQSSNSIVQPTSLISSRYSFSRSWSIADEFGSVGASGSGWSCGTMSGNSESCSPFFIASFTKSVYL